MKATAVPKFPPRGVGRPGEAAEKAQWQHPEELDPKTWDYRAGNDLRSVLLGCCGPRLIGRADDRHMVTIAGSRAGKSRTVLIPNLLRYPGPAVVVDPKGELYKATAEVRSRPVSKGGLGHRVFLLNPFNVDGLSTHGHNPFAELKQSKNLSADAAQIADALIIPPEKGDSHWTDSAKNLITGLMLHALDMTPDEASIPLLRWQLAHEAGLLALFNAMVKNEELDGVIKNIGASMSGKFTEEAGKAPVMSNELRSIISTAVEQTRPLDDVRPALTRHDFNLSDFSGEQPMTVYLVLPATRISTHHRWLRLFIYQLIAALERHPIARDRLPLWLVLEEFAALGNLRTIETAAGYMAGMGCKLWAVLQDLTQLKTHYPHSWETFLGNAGVIQAFGVVDVTTTRYLSDLLGQTTVIEEQMNFVTAAQRSHGDDGTRQNLRSVPLLAPAEITLHFARETEQQMIFVPGQKPAYLKRLDDRFIK